MSLSDSRERITDSFGSRSDHSGHSAIFSSSRPKMDVVCVIDLVHNERINSRKKAYEEIKIACQAVAATCYHIQVSTISMTFGTIIS